MATSGKKMVINDMSIYYETHGSGPIVVLLIHGAVGSSNDFKQQLNPEFGLEKEWANLKRDNNDGLTIVTLDLPGLGRSQLKHADLHHAEPGTEYFRLCAEICGILMEKLGHKTYSVGGWSDGARVAAILATKRQSRINSLLLWGFVPVMDDISAKGIARSRDTNNWDPEVLETYSSVYGDQRFAELWREYVDFIVAGLEQPLDHRFDIRDELKQIKCPTIVMHGSEDPIVSFKAHVKPIEMQIYDSEILQINGASHNIHQAYPDKFNSTFARLINVVSAY